MIRIKKYLENCLENLEYELEYYECHYKQKEVQRIEDEIENINREIDILCEILDIGEANIVKINKDNTFHLWSIRNTNINETVVEEYLTDFNLEWFDFCELNECECIDVSNVFNLGKIINKIHVSDHIPNDTKSYYLIGDDNLFYLE